MRIYLDCCCLQRPLDSQIQPRIRVEAEAVLAILSAVQAGEHAMLSSEALEFEIDRIPDEHRRMEALAVLDLAGERLEISGEVETLAELLERDGVRPMDAVHLALASAAHADYFATCDDRLLRKAKAVSGLNCKVVSVLELVREVVE